MIIISLQLRKHFSTISDLWDRLNNCHKVDHCMFYRQRDILNILFNLLANRNLMNRQHICYLYHKLSIVLCSRYDLLLIRNHYCLMDKSDSLYSLIRCRLHNFYRMVNIILNRYPNINQVHSLYRYHLCYKNCKLLNNR